jgi:general secretion pathway protein K
MRNRRLQSRGGGQRGVALILVLTTIAILTAVGVDFSYSSRVSLKLAENLRDETRAYYMAKSGINLARLLLHFQKQVDGMGNQLSGALSGIFGNSAGGAKSPIATALGLPPGGTAGGAASSSLGIRLWEILPIDSNAFTGFLSGNVTGLDSLAKPAEDGATRAAPEARLPEGSGRAEHVFGGFDGAFGTKIVDENSRINVQSLDALQTAPLATLIQLRALMSDPKYNFIFDEEDAQHDKVARDDIALAMKDWIDLDESGSALDPSNTTNPFVTGFSDENSSYDRYTPRYKAKNAHFDSLEELYMVRGVSDRFMQAFGDRLTIWPDFNGHLNINTNDPLQMATNVLTAAANPNDPRLRDPRLMATILQEIQLHKMFSFFGMSAQDFISILLQNGIRVRAELDPRMNQGNSANVNQYFSSTSDTFRITATGRIGRLEKKVTAVVKYDDLMGKLLYWKEE